MSAEAADRPEEASLRSALIIGVAVALVGVLFFVPGLGELGLWSDGELAVFDRSRAALGEPLRGLERRPWLPDALRTLGLASLGPELGLRLPGAIAGAMLAGLAAGLARRRGAAPPIAMLAGLFVLAFPGVMSGARTALGNPIGELVATLAIVVGAAATRHGRRRDLATRHGRRRDLALALALLALALAALAVSALGLILGAAVPAAAVALAHGPDEDRPWLRPAIGTLAATLAVIALALAWRQGNGFVPVLGAARDLRLLDAPEGRAYSDALEELGYFLFPWLPLAALGAILPARDRWPGLWLLLGLGALLPWTAIYGPTPAPLAVPAALACAAGAEHLWDPDRPRNGRRLALLVVLAGLLIFGKDGERTPHRVGSPLHSLERPDRYPHEVIGMDHTADRVVDLALLAVALGFLISAPSRTEEDPPMSRWASALRERADALPARVRHGAPAATLGLAVLAQAFVFARVVAPANGEQLSLRAPFDRYETLAVNDQVPRPIGLYRIRDPGLAQYGPTPEHRAVLDSRADLFMWMHGEEPAVAMIRRTELPPLHSRSRAGNHPLFVLDDGHHDLLLVANRRPDGLEDHNPIPTVLVDELPRLEHPTSITWDGRLELVGWEFEGPVRRGHEATIVLAFEVHKPVPGNAELYARLQMRKLSRINARPHPFVDRIYPPGNWRPGDKILHRFTFEVSRLEAFPGPHDFVMGIRRSERENLAVSSPEGKKGPHGEVIRGKKREFEALGQVDVE